MAAQRYSIAAIAAMIIGAFEAAVKPAMTVNLAPVSQRRRRQ